MSAEARKIFPDGWRATMPLIAMPCPPCSPRLFFQALSAPRRALERAAQPSYSMRVSLKPAPCAMRR